MEEAPDDLRFVIIYRDRSPFMGTCRSGRDVKDTIRYWMGKSPGMYRDDIEQIITFPIVAYEDRTSILGELDAEEMERDHERAEKAERSEYERLRKKFASVALLALCVWFCGCANMASLTPEQRAGMLYAAEGLQHIPSPPVVQPAPIVVRESYIPTGNLPGEMGNPFYIAP